MAFTDVEMAILSKLSYYKLPEKNTSLYKFIDTYKDKLHKDLGEGYADAINDLLTKTQNGEYTIVKSEDDNKGTGFAAFAFKDSDNNVTVACRGSEELDKVLSSEKGQKDLKADLELAFLVSNSQQDKMKEFMDDLEKTGYDGYYFTGHSLGGNLAAYGAITLNPIEKVKGVVIFNAPGFNEAFISKYAAEIAAIYQRVSNYQNEYDYVSSLLFPVGVVTIIESNGELGDHLKFGDHMLSNLTVDGNGFDAKDIQVKGILQYGAHGLAELLRTGTGMKQWNLFVGVLEIGVNFGRFAASAYKKISNWIKDLFSGKNADTYGSFIHVDTGSLRAYADRLIKVNNRISKLDRRLDTLYTQVGLRDLFKLIEVDALTGYSWRLNKCINYLNDTAADFESIERAIANQI